MNDWRLSEIPLEPDLAGPLEPPKADGARQQNDLHGQSKDADGLRIVERSSPDTDQNPNNRHTGEYESLRSSRDTDLSWPSGWRHDVHVLGAGGSAQRPELRHAGLMKSSAKAELETPSRVACSDSLGVFLGCSRRSGTSTSLVRSSLPFQRLLSQIERARPRHPPFPRL